MRSRAAPAGRRFRAAMRPSPALCQVARLVALCGGYCPLWRRREIPHRHQRRLARAPGRRTPLCPHAFSQRSPAAGRQRGAACDLRAWPQRRRARAWPPPATAVADGNGRVSVHRAGRGGFFRGGRTLAVVAGARVGGRLEGFLTLHAGRRGAIGEEARSGAGERGPALAYVAAAAEEEAAAAAAALGSLSTSSMLQPNSFSKSFAVMDRMFFGIFMISTRSRLRILSTTWSASVYMERHRMSTAPGRTPAALSAPLAPHTGPNVARWGHWGGRRGERAAPSMSISSRKSLSCCSRSCSSGSCAFPSTSCSTDALLTRRWAALRVRTADAIVGTVAVARVRPTVGPQCEFSTGSGTRPMRRTSLSGARRERPRTSIGGAAPPESPADGPRESLGARDRSGRRCAAHPAPHRMHFLTAHLESRPFIVQGHAAAVACAGRTGPQREGRAKTAGRRRGRGDSVPVRHCRARWPRSALSHRPGAVLTLFLAMQRPAVA